MDDCRSNDNRAIWEHYVGDWPPTSSVDLEVERVRLNWPEYLNLEEPWIRRAIGVAGACHAADDVPLAIGFFGGVAFRLHCPSCSQSGSAFFRDPADMDLSTISSQGKQVVERLCRMVETHGTWFAHFVTTADRNFNRMRQGKRYQLRTLHPSTRDKPEFCKVDVVADRLEFCHRVPIVEVVTGGTDPLCTIGLVNLLLSKLQYIRAVDDGPDIPCDRVLMPFGRHEVLIGMEDKDLRDVAALVHDHELGSGPERIDPNLLMVRLRSDWALSRTVILNLHNIAEHPERLAALGIDQTGTDLLRRRFSELLQTLEPVASLAKPLWRKVVGGQWWETVDDI